MPPLAIALAVVIVIVATGLYFAYGTSTDALGASVSVLGAPAQPTFTFFQGKDASGTNIGQSPHANDVPALIKDCLEAKCVAFNTNGWMKSYIGPQSQWGTWTSDPTKGLYVLDSELAKLM